MTYWVAVFWDGRYEARYANAKSDEDLMIQYANKQGIKLLYTGEVKSPKHQDRLNEFLKEANKQGRIDINRLEQILV